MHAQMSTLILTLILVCHYGQAYQLLFLHLSGSGVANVTLLLPNMSLQNEDDILEHLNEVNNDEAFQQICDLLKQHQKAKQFVEKLKETFTDVDVSHPTRVHQYAVEFVNEFRNKVKGATLRAERACGFEKLYNKDGNRWMCEECDETFRSKAHVTKHLRATHKCNELEALISNDQLLQEYKSSPFYYTGIRTKTDNPPAASLSKESMAQRLKIKDDRIAHLQKQLKIQEKRADKAEEEARKNQAEDLNDTIDGEELSPKLPAALTPDSDIIIINRNSSVKGSNALHATRYTPNESVKGRYHVKPTLITPIPVPHRRKRSDEDFTKNKMQKKRITDAINSVTDEIIARGSNTSNADQTIKNKVITSTIKKQGANNIKDIVTPDLMKDITSLDTEKVASLITETQMTRQQFRKVVRAQNNANCPKLFKNEKAVNAARSRMSKGINRDLYESEQLQLHVKKQGENVAQLEFRPILYPKCVKTLISKVLEIEGSELSCEINEDGTKILYIGLAFDSGGGSTKMQMAFMNNSKGEIKDHMLLVMEASDTKHNNVKAFSRGLRKGLADANGAVIESAGEKYRIHFMGVFDLKVI